MHPAQFTITAVHPALAGHFPGQPLVPGALLLAEVIEAALDRPDLAARFGPAPGIASVKFLSPVVPPTLLSVHFDATGTRIRFELRCGTQVAAVGLFEAAGDATRTAAKVP